MKVDPAQAVGQIAVEFKEAIPVFEKFNINYYSEGNRTLREACYIAGVPMENIAAALEEVQHRHQEWYKQEPDWWNESMADLIVYIVGVHHVYTRGQLNRIEEMLDALTAKKGKSNPELIAVRRLFLKMAEDLRVHLLREEETVFPYLIQAERAVQRNEPIPRPFTGYNSFTHPIRALLFEHGMMDREWRDIVQLTHHFEPPASQRKMLRPLYEAMKELEKDDEKHIHLENNILLKKATQMGLLD